MSTKPPGSASHTAAIKELFERDPAYSSLPAPIKKDLAQLHIKIFESAQLISLLDNETSLVALGSRLSKVTDSARKITLIAQKKISKYSDHAAAGEEITEGTKVILRSVMSAVAHFCLGDMNKIGSLYGRYWEECGSVMDGDPEWAEHHIHEHPDKLYKVLQETIQSTKAFKGAKLGAGSLGVPPKPKDPGAASGGGGGHESAPLYSIIAQAASGYAEAEKKSSFAAPIGIHNPAQNCFLNASAQVLLHAYAGKLHTLPKSKFRDVVMAMDREMLPVHGALTTDVSHALRHAIRLDGMVEAAPGGTLLIDAMDAAGVDGESLTVFDHVFKGVEREPYGREGTIKTDHAGDRIYDEAGNPVIDSKPIQDVLVKPLILPSTMQDPLSLTDLISEPTHHVEREFYSAPHDFFVGANYGGAQCSGFPFHPFVLEDSITLVDGTSHFYELDAFTQHRGGEIGGGHYVAYVKKGAQWFEINDSHVYPISDEAAKAAATPSTGSRPIVLHYVKTFSVDAE